MGHTRAPRHTHTHTDSLGCMMIPVCVCVCVCARIETFVNLEGGVTFEIGCVPFLCLGSFLNGSHAVLPVLMSLFCTPGQTCDGCEMYLGLCVCMIYPYKTRHAYIHRLYITFPYVLKSIYRYMYMNCSGSQAISGELLGTAEQQQYLLLHRDNRSVGV